MFKSFMVNIPITGKSADFQPSTVLLWYKLKDVDHLRVGTSTVRWVWQFANGPKCVDDTCWWSPSIMDKHVHECIALIPCMAHIAHSFGCRVIVERKKIYWSCLYCILSCFRKTGRSFSGRIGFAHVWTRIDTHCIHIFPGWGSLKWSEDQGGGPHCAVNSQTAKLGFSQSAKNCSSGEIACGLSHSLSWWRVSWGLGPWFLQNWGCLVAIWIEKKS